MKWSPNTANIRFPFVQILETIRDGFLDFHLYLLGSFSIIVISQGYLYLDINSSNSSFCILDLLELLYTIDPESAAYFTVTIGSVASIIGLIIGSVLCGYFASLLAKEKGYSTGRWFAYGFFFSIFALIAAAGLPSNPRHTEAQEKGPGLGKLSSPRHTEAQKRVPGLDKLSSAERQFCDRVGLFDYIKRLDKLIYFACGDVDDIEYRKLGITEDGNEKLEIEVILSAEIRDFHKAERGIFEIFRNTIPKEKQSLISFICRLAGD